VTDQPEHWGRAGLVVLRGLAPHPTLWWTGVCTLARLAPRDWWRRAPFLPIPPGRYWHFRLVTAFGGTGDGKAMSPDDVVAYLRWCRRAHPRRG
jgi:hypothetical protein